MSAVKSIERAFALLRALAVGPAGVTELSERSGLPKSTVARLLSTLESEGAVAQEQSWGKYELGPTITDLAGSAAPGHSLIAAARPYLWKLTELTGETSGLSILDGTDVVYLDHIESTEEVQVRNWTGERVAVHLVPSGLVMLAHQSDAQIENYLARDLLATTSQSVTDPEIIRKRLKEARDTPAIWGHGEFDEGINSVAAPVVGSSGKVNASLHIHGPAYRFPAVDQADAIAAALADSAQRLSFHLD